MKLQAIKYSLILFLVTSFVACNFLKKKERQNFTTIKFEKLITNETQYQQILHDSLRLDIENDSAFLPSGEKAKLFLLKVGVKNNSEDSLKILKDILNELKTESPFHFQVKSKKWNFDGYNERMMKNERRNYFVCNEKSEIHFYKIFLSDQIQDSMMFRYYFKTSQFKDSLMWHDVYYTFKNDSFIIVRQTENEK